MASSLCRWVGSVAAKKRPSFSRFVVVIDAKPFSDSKNTWEHHRKENEFPGNRKTLFITSGIVVGAGLGYTLYKWKNELFPRFDDSGTILPTIRAASGNIIPPDIGGNRGRYNFIADVVEISAPSVVYIEIKDTKRRDFFTGSPTTTSNGSGFIVEEDGLIITNAHVVSKPNSLIKVRLQDGSTHTGVVEDIDFEIDLATVRIDKKNLPVMKLGNSANIRPGEFVVAIGSPLSLSNSITSGVISSVNRPSAELGLRQRNIGYIQTDAAITFGNSGGPLVNLSGEAIGISAMKVTPGISFATPIDCAKDFLKKAELRRKNKGLVGTDNQQESTVRRYMGITMLTLTPDILLELQQRNSNIPFSVKHGVLVWKVMVGSPAYVGGLKAGDIVTHVNDQPVVTAMSIYQVLEEPGPLLLRVQRNGELLQMKVDPEDV